MCMYEYVVGTYVDTTICICIHTHRAGVHDCVCNVSDISLARCCWCTLRCRSTSVVTARKRFVTQPTSVIVKSYTVCTSRMKHILQVYTYKRANQTPSCVYEIRHEVVYFTKQHSSTFLLFVCYTSVEILC